MLKKSESYSFSQINFEYDSNTKNHGSYLDSPTLKKYIREKRINSGLIPCLIRGPMPDVNFARFIFFFADATIANSPFEGVVHAKGRMIESVIRFNPWHPTDSENETRIARRIGSRRAPRKSPCNSNCRFEAGLCFPTLKGEETPARW